MHQGSSCCEITESSYRSSNIILQQSARLFSSLCSCLNWLRISLLTWSACQCLTRGIPPAVFPRVFLSSVVSQLNNAVFSKDRNDSCSRKGIVNQKVPREFCPCCIHFIKMGRAKYQRGRGKRHGASILRESRRVCLCWVNVTRSHCLQRASPSSCEVMVRPMQCIRPPSVQ